MIINLEEQKLTTANQRLRYVRSLLRVTRAYLQEKYGMPEVTLKSWENGTTKLTKAGAKRCVEIYRNENLIVSENWILTGSGLDPKIGVSINHYLATPITEELSTKDDEIAMARDANIFKESHSNAVVMMVSNDEMAPFYKPGDYIGGKVREDDIQAASNKDCIVYLKNAERLFRRVIRNSSGGYNLTCLNPNKVTSEPVLYNVEIVKIAPIIWHRWKDE